MGRSGCMGDDFYKDRIVEFMNRHIMPDGTIKYLDVNELNLDKINSGKILFFLYEQTGEERYKKALDTLIDMLHRHPRTSTFIWRFRCIWNMRRNTITKRITMMYFLRCRM